MLMPTKYRRLEDYFKLIFVANMPTVMFFVTEEQLT